MTADTIVGIRIKKDNNITLFILLFFIENFLIVLSSLCFIFNAQLYGLDDISSAISSSR